MRLAAVCLLFPFDCLFTAVNKINNSRALRVVIQSEVDKFISATASSFTYSIEQIDLAFYLIRSDRKNLFILINVSNFTRQ